MIEELPDDIDSDELDDVEPVGDEAQLYEHFRVVVDKGQEMVRVLPFGGETPRLATSALAGKDYLTITVSGHTDQTLLTAQFDNLGKGASGAAVQNMNLMLGFPETTGLNL